MFTARKEAKATHAEYNGALLEDLLRRWKDGMGKNEAGETFCVSIATTDNDPRERHALQVNWPDSFLVLCMFHTYQAWRNGLNKHLRVIPKGVSRQQIRRRLGGFLMRLLRHVTVYEEAVTEYNTEVTFFKNLGQERTQLAKKMSKGGLAFLAYFNSYLKLRSFWLSWSKAGIIEAAARSGLPIKKIARTSNHVESFNGRIKGKYFIAYLRSGRLPRIDMWILTIITKVMPSFFQNQKDKQTLDDYYDNLRHVGPSVNKKSGKLDEDTEDAQILDIILDDSEDDSSHEGSQVEDDDDVENMDGYGLELNVEANGNSSVSTCSNSDPSSASIPSDSLPATPNDHDNALDESLIICDLPDDIAVPFLYDHSASESDSDVPTGLLPPLRLQAALKPSVSKERTNACIVSSNEEATAMQRVLLAEDALAHEIRLFLQITSTPNVMVTHISPAIQARLSGSPDSILDLMLPTEAVRSPTTQKVSVSPSISLSPSWNLSSSELPSNVPHTLVSFPRQTKTRRHESHGIR
jgi:hypothetical protein